MSEIIVVNQTNNQAHFDYDYSKIFVFNNRYEEATFINLTGGALDYAIGTVVGRISATGKITEMKSAATDGSELPIGILATGLTQLAGSGELLVTMCIAGDVAEEKVVLNGADTLATAEQGRIYRDWLTLVGIILKLGRDLTNYDNQ